MFDSKATHKSACRCGKNEVPGSIPGTPTNSIRRTGEKEGEWLVSSMAERFVYIEDVGGSSPSPATPNFNLRIEQVF